MGDDAIRRHKADPITIGMLAGGLILGVIGAAVAASYSYAHSAGLVVSLIWWAIFFGALGASLGALPGLFTQRARLHWDADTRHPVQVARSIPPKSTPPMRIGKPASSHPQRDEIVLCT